MIYIIIALYMKHIDCIQETESKTFLLKNGDGPHCRTLVPVQPKKQRERSIKTKNEC